MKNLNLSKQLVCIIIIIFAILCASIGYVLPNVLLPIYESNIYTILNQPLNLINTDNFITSEENQIAFIYVKSQGQVLSSDNLEDIINLPADEIIKLLNAKQGKFIYKGSYYFYTLKDSNQEIKIALTNDSYLNHIKNNILNAIFPILFFTLLIVLGLVLLWSQLLIRKIENIKTRIDNLDNDNYNKKFNYYFEDELYSLSNSIDDMKATLKKQDEYKNQMYQNISHDFKTPLTVIKSYIEGIEDGIQDTSTGMQIIKEQVEKLEIKVHSLLYLNKLNYIKETKKYKNEKTDVLKVINQSVKKFKAVRPDIKWEIKTDTKTVFRGTYDTWEAIIDNLLNNFMRYTKENIKITLRNGKITLYNDGNNIDPNILKDIFNPYKKGINGQFGLGLSIVKQTILLFGYEIIVHNEKKGVCFIIK